MIKNTAKQANIRLTPELLVALNAYTKDSPISNSVSYAVRSLLVESLASKGYIKAKRGKEL